MKKECDAKRGQIAAAIGVVFPGASHDLCDYGQAIRGKFKNQDLRLFVGDKRNDSRFRAIAAMAIDDASIIYRALVGKNEILINLFSKKIEEMTDLDQLAGVAKACRLISYARRALNRLEELRASDSIDIVRRKAVSKEVRDLAKKIQSSPGGGIW